MEEVADLLLERPRRKEPYSPREHVSNVGAASLACRVVVAVVVNRFFLGIYLDLARLSLLMDRRLIGMVE